jgi:ElaB/YqjD/DUF883 family membrane-anchored ribosome-binding protein
MTMSSETSDTMKTMSGSSAETGSSMSAPESARSAAIENTDNVQRVAEKAHDAVDKVKRTLSSGTGRVMDWQEEYGEMAREEIRANPLAVVFGAFAIGYLLAKLTR